LRLLRTLCAVLITVLLASSAGTVVAQSTLEDARAEREQIRRERASAATQLDVSRAADAELAEALADLTAQVSAQQGLVEEARRKLAAAEEAFVAAQERVAEAVAAQAGLWDQLRDRAVATFVGEGLSSTELLLSVDHPTEALRRATLVAHVQADTADVLEDLRSLEQDRVLAQAEADAAQRAAVDWQAELTQGLVALEEQRDAQAVLKAELERRIAGWETQVAAFAAEEEKLTAFIQAEVAAAEARRRAAEEEARRRAAEEAAAREAAAQEAAAQEQARRQAAEQSRRVTVAEAEAQTGSSGSSAADSSASDPSGSSSSGAGGATSSRVSDDEPAAPATTTTTTTAPPARAASSSGFQWPVSGRLSSGFGYRVHPIFGTRRLHAGLDVGAPTGTPIYAAKAGTVLSSGWRDGYGNTVTILHDGGIVTLYAHMSRTAASTGSTVSGGELIGYVGSTGWSTGPHLHFEVRVNGSPVDPRPYLP
jgi:murein DD-endopeptidase MepM/ murein hydrolase activator NlpD